MNKVFVTALLLAIFSSFLCTLAFHRHEKDSGFRMEENLAEGNDVSLDDREARVESDSLNGNLDFDTDDGKRNDDDDLFFSQEDDDEMEKTKR